MYVYSVDSVEELRKQSQQLRQLAKECCEGKESTGATDYFIPRLSPRARPRVVLCQDGRTLVGAVYTEERCFLGRPTGWIQGGDALGRGLVAADKRRQIEVLEAACSYLLDNGAHALRLTWNQFPDKLAFPNKNIGIRTSSIEHEYGDWLQLARTYDEFLNGLGTHTRRNLRYYRRRAESLGYRFVSDLSPEQYSARLQVLNTIADYRSIPGRSERDLRFLEHFGNPLVASILAPEGHSVSLLAAVRSGSHLHVVNQVNDDRLPRMSLSLVLRGYLIEQSIQMGITDIHFMNGASPMLGRYCDPVSVHLIELDDLDSPWHAPLRQIGKLTARWGARRGHEATRLQHILGTYLPRSTEVGGNAPKVPQKSGERNAETLASS